VGRGKLAVEQRHPGHAQRRHQPGQRHFRGIAAAAEHALAAEHFAKAHAIEPADQLAHRFATGALRGDPCFDRMGMAELVERAIAFADALRDPAVFGAFARRGAGIDHRVEGFVAGHGKVAAPQRARERARAMEPVERENRAQARLHPIDFRVVAAVRHREDAGAIGPEQEVGRDHDRGRLQHDG
jgi:hypothetical protein